MTEQTLVLNATFEPLKVVPWQRAVTLWYEGKAEVIESYDRVIRSASFSMPLPSVVRLVAFVKLKRRPLVQFTRANIYQRDDFTCQFCGVPFEPEDLTFDHVVPVAQGGKRGWGNIVTACEPCNRKKGARTPAEAGMTLLRQPTRPKVLAPAAKLTLGWRTPAAWRAYAYWNVPLEE